MDIPDTQGLQAAGWRGFLGYTDMLESLAALLLLTSLGALLAFHPTTQRMVDTIEEVELPKVQILGVLIGAIEYVIRAPRNCNRSALENVLIEKVALDLRGDLDRDMR